MKARLPDKTTMQKSIDEAQNNAIKLCMVTFMQSLDDVGLSESTMKKIYKKQKSYIDSIRAKTVTWQEIAENLQQEKGITFEWIEG